MILYVLIETLKNVKTFKVHCGIRFIVIQVNTLIYLGHGLKTEGKCFNIEMPMTFCFAAP